MNTEWRSSLLLKKMLVTASAGILMLGTSVELNAQYSRTGYRYGNPYKSQYQRIALGYDHSLELRNGSIYASGINDFGQLGLGNTVNQVTQQQVGVDSNWVLLAVGAKHSLALKADGSLWAWGSNVAGQLGTGNTVSEVSPIAIGQNVSWRSIAAGSDFSVGIKNDGTLWAWGGSASGQAGNNGTNVLQASQIGTANNWIAISAGEQHVLALRADGSLWAWGANDKGQLGQGTSDLQVHATPVQVGTSKGWDYIAAGGRFSVAVKNGGTLWAWGDNQYGQSLSAGNNLQTTPQQIGTAKNWSSVVAGRYHSLALKTDGTVWTWGRNDNLSLGTGIAGVPNSPVQLIGIPAGVAIAAGEHNSVFFSSQGAMYGVGANANGALGSGNTIALPNAIPLRTHNEIVKIKAAQSGFYTALLSSNGHVHAWGANDDGQLATGNTTSLLAPTPISAIGNNNVTLALGGWHTLVIKDNGTLWGWGNNNSGELGIGSNSASLTPVQIGIDSSWTQVSANIGHSAGVKADGTLWTWGSNTNGKLGTGDNVSRNQPGKVGNDSDWVNVFCGSSHNVALKANGTLWAWGRNYAGDAAGGASTADIMLPQQIGTDSNWTYVMPQSMITMAVKADGTMWGWGTNGSKQIDNGTAIKYAEPQQIGTGDWMYGTPGNFTSSGLKDNGTLRSWGNLGIFGEMALGHNTGEPNGADVTGIRDIIQLTGGQAHRGILNANRNTLCMVGRNYDGEVGMGSLNPPTYNTYQCGISIAPPVNPVADSISVTTLNGGAAIITANNGFLDLKASVFPATASQDVNWQIISGLGTGTATVNNLGRVVALTNGNVWAKATSVANVNLSDSIEIDLSNQIIAIDSVVIQLPANATPVITTLNATLDLAAQVYPANAVQDVDWSIVPLTGDANIDATGLITAIANGTVQAIATSVIDNTKSDTLLVTIDAETSIHDLRAQLAIQLYPNPTQGKLRLVTSATHPAVTVNLIDPRGRVMNSVYLKENTMQNGLDVDLTNHAAGNYIIEIRTNNNDKASYKIIKL